MSLSIQSDLRYPNTVRLNFNVPVGLDFEQEVDEEDVDSHIEDSQQISETFSLVETEVLERINNIIVDFYESLGLECELDWRDSNEIEIHTENDVDFESNDLVDYMMTELTDDLK